MKLNTASRNTAAETFQTMFAGGKLRLYSGSPPASPNDAASGTLLVEITLPNPCFSSGVNGVISLTGAWFGNALDAGTIGWFRLLNSALTKWIDGNVTVTGGSGEIDIDVIVVVLGSSVQINNATLTQPESI